MSDSRKLIADALLEIVEQGEAKTPFLKFGDRVRIEMFDAQGASIFGTIENQVDTHSLDK